MKKSVYILALIIVFAAGYFSSNLFEDNNRSINVMSFNIRYNNPGDGDNAWPNRKDIAAGMITFHKADLIGIQEALIDQIDDLTERLPGYDWYGIGRDDGLSGGEFSAIFYRRDRFELVESSTFWLSETPKTPSKSWDSSLNRIVSWIRLSDRFTGRDFYHFNTHYDHRGETARQESAKLLLRKIEEIAGNLPVIVTGDFNADPESEPFRILTEAGNGLSPLTEAGSISLNSHHGPTGSMSYFREPGTPGQMIDFIFIKNGVDVLRHGVLSDTFDGRFPSDHMPVLAEVIIK
ncbi:MAG: endonuclease/exonuclease/phosphatase family protein [bacterium]|nr:endonuclease/exonuclease/phosphatase family protein [bacterium]